jgi:hypothetical protein
MNHKYVKTVREADCILVRKHTEDKHILHPIKESGTNTARHIMKEDLTLWSCDPVLGVLHKRPGIEMAVCYLACSLQKT